MTVKQIIATAMANARGMRKGMPSIGNVISLLPETLQAELIDDTENVLVELTKAGYKIEKHEDRPFAPEQLLELGWEKVGEAGYHKYKGKDYYSVMVVGKAIQIQFHLMDKLGREVGNPMKVFWGKPQTHAELLTLLKLVTGSTE